MFTRTKLLLKPDGLCVDWAKTDHGEEPDVVFESPARTNDRFMPQSLHAQLPEHPLH